MKKGAEANAENSALCPKPELALPNDKSIPIDSVVNKRTVPTEAKVEDPQACSKPKLASSIDLPAPTNQVIWVKEKIIKITQVCRKISI